MGLQEQIDLAVAEVLIEARTGFDFRKFKAIDDPEERFDYASSKLQKLGEGSSRAAFRLSNRYVLKVVIPDAIDKGVAQSHAEVELYTDPKVKPVLANIYEMADDYTWLISEPVRTFEFKEFYKTTGLIDTYTFDKAHTYLNKTDSIEGGKQEAKRQVEARKELLQQAEEEYEKARANPEEHEDTLISFLARKVESYKKKIRLAEKVTSLYDNPFFLAIVELIDEFGVMRSDLLRTDHWGVTADGRIVLLDYGYTFDVADRYY